MPWWAPLVNAGRIGLWLMGRSGAGFRAGALDSPFPGGGLPRVKIFRTKMSGRRAVLRPVV